MPVAEAVKWYSKGAELRDASALVGLGDIYQDGYGVIKDEVEAYKWYLLANAERDEIVKINEDAKNRVDKIEQKLGPLQRAEGQRRAREWRPNGKGVAEDDFVEVKWYRKEAEQSRKAAEQGDAEAQLKLGFM